MNLDVIDLSGESRAMGRWCLLFSALFVVLWGGSCRRTAAPTSERSLTGTASESRNAGGHLWVIQWDVKEDGQLAFVAMRGGKLGTSDIPVRSLVSGGGWMRAGESKMHHSATLTRPDGIKVQLPTDKQLFEYVDGKYTEAPGDVTVAEFQTWLESEPEAYTIQKLKDFVERHRQNNGYGTTTTREAGVR